MKNWKGIVVYGPLHIEDLTTDSPSDSNHLVLEDLEVLYITLGLPMKSMNGPWSSPPKTYRNHNFHLKAWYMSPALLDGTSYFKSMDGHRTLAPGFVLRNVPEWSLTLHQLHRHLLCGTPQPGITRLPKKATTTRRRRPGMHGISASSASIFMWPGWQQALSLMGPVFTHRSHSFAACLQAKFVEHRWTGKSELTGLGE